MVKNIKELTSEESRYTEKMMMVPKSNSSTSKGH